MSILCSVESYQRVCGKLLGNINEYFRIRACGQEVVISNHIIFICPSFKCSLAYLEELGLTGYCTAPSIIQITMYYIVTVTHNIGYIDYNNKDFDY